MVADKHIVSWAQLDHNHVQDNMLTPNDLQDESQHLGVQTHCTAMLVADLDACLCPDELHRLRLLINQHQTLNGVLYDEGILNDMPCLCWKAQHLFHHPKSLTSLLGQSHHSHTSCILG